MKALCNAIELFDVESDFTPEQLDMKEDILSAPGGRIDKEVYL